MRQLFKTRKEYQSEYYKKRKAAKEKKAAEIARTRLKNPERSVFDAKRDYRVPHDKWAAKLTEAVQRGLSVWNWLTWLAVVQPKHVGVFTDHTIGRVHACLHRALQRQGVAR